MNPFRTYKQVKTRDKKKINDYSSKYRTIIVWEYDYNNKKEIVFDFIKKIINGELNENKDNKTYWETKSI